MGYMADDPDNLKEGDLVEVGLCRGSTTTYRAVSRGCSADGTETLKLEPVEAI